MSEERLARIEEKLVDLEAGQEGLRRDMQAGHADLRREMQAGHAELRREMQAGYEDLGHQMRVLHEETIDTIKALAPDFGPIRREFTDADEKLREDIDRRLTPLETLARTHRQGPTP